MKLHQTCPSFAPPFPRESQNEEHGTYVNLLLARVEWTVTVFEGLQLGNPVLRMKSTPVKNAAPNEIARLRDDLADASKFWRVTLGYERGIAAPQIGVLKRVTFINTDELGFL